LRLRCACPGPAIWSQWRWSTGGFALPYLDIIDHHHKAARKLPLLDNIFEFNQHNRDLFIREFAAGTQSGMRVLDAGAGPCKYRPLFSQCKYESQDFAKYEGSDHRYGELDYICDITSIPVADASFDRVICTEVLEHVPHPEKVIAELARILKPGGLVAITAPLISGIHMAPYHFCSGFSPYWYRHFMPLSGLSVESCKPNGGFFAFYGQESRRFLYKMTPRNPAGRLLFFPLKLLLAIWFRLIVPVACHFLDKIDTQPDLTVGYFVVARKNSANAAE